MTSDVAVNQTDRPIPGIFGSPESEYQTMVKKNTEGLFEQTQKSRKAFEDISIVLDLFDSYQGEHIGPLRPSWDALGRKYNDCLSQSKSDTNLIRAICDDYRANILSLLDDISWSDTEGKHVRLEVLYSIKTAEKGAKVASKTCYNINDFRQDIKRFGDIHGSSAANERAQLALAQVQSSFNIITGQLSALAVFWKAIEEELNGTVLYMNAVDENTTFRETKKVLGDRLVGGIYKNLNEILGKYIAQIDV